MTTAEQITSPSQPQSISERMRHGAKWIFAGRLVVAGSQFLSTIIVAQLLGVEYYGLVAIATSISFVLDTITKLSLSNALIRHPNPTSSHFDTAFTLNLLRAIIMVGFLLVLAQPIADLYDDQRLRNVLFVLAGATAVLGLISPKLALLNRNLQFRQEFILNLVDRMALLIISILVASIYRSYWAVVLGVLAGNIARVVASFFIAGYRPRLSLHQSKDLLSFSIWLSLGQTIGALVHRADHLMIGLVLGNASVGVFTMASRLANLTTIETSKPVAQSGFPALAKLAKNGDLVGTARGYQRLQSLLMLVALPMGLFTAVLADPMIKLLMGKEWLGAVIVVQWLAVVLSLQTLSSMARPLSMAMGDTKSIFRRDITLMGTRIPLVFAGLMAGGLIGLLIGRVIAGLITTFLDAGLAKRQIGLSYSEQLRVNLRSLVAGAGLAAVAIGIGELMGSAETAVQLVEIIVVQAFAGLCAYVSILWALCKMFHIDNGPEKELTSTIYKMWCRLRPVASR